MAAFRRRAAAKVVSFTFFRRIESQHIVHPLLVPPSYLLVNQSAFTAVAERVLIA